MSDDRVWLINLATGGTFHCPTDAVDGWLELGWVPGEPPVETNPALADILAERARAEQVAAATEQEKPTTKPSKQQPKES